MTVGFGFCSVLNRVLFGLGSCTFLTFSFALVIDETWIIVWFVLAGLVFFPISIFDKNALRGDANTAHWH